MKQELDQQAVAMERARPAGTANNLLKIKNNQRREAATTKLGPGGLTRYPPAHAEAEGSRATMSLLSNKPLRVANHCAQNLIVEPHLAPTDQRMIKNKKVATVSSAIGYYGLNMNSYNNPYAKPTDRPAETSSAELERTSGREKDQADPEDKAAHQSVPAAEGLKININH